jgi:hypothetical protein
VKTRLVSVCPWGQLAAVSSLMLRVTSKAASQVRQR